MINYFTYSMILYLTNIASVLSMFRLPSKGSTFATVALIGIDVALADMNYRGSGSLELLIEKGRALRPCQP
jgi:hypothetical protein